MTLPTTTSVHALIKAALIAGGVAAVDGPAKNLPTRPDGTIAPFAVLYPSAGFHAYSRATGTQSGRTDRVTVICGGLTVRDALAVADKVEAAIGGRVFPGCSPMRQEVATQPTPEPNADPVRVSLALEYSTITKG